MVRSPNGLEVVGHEATSSWQRDRSSDYEQDSEADRFRFDAYRFRADRSVVRFAARTDFGLAGVFVGLPLGDAHQVARSVARQAADILFPEIVQRVDIGRAQVRLDDPGQVDPTVRTSRSRTRGQGAYIEFGSNDPDGNFSTVEAVRQVRLAVRDR